jgi:hypothetical protein
MKAEELQKLGVKLENLTYENGEMNIIVQQFPSEVYEENDNDDESPTINVAYPDVYMPRRNTVYSYGDTGAIIDLDDPDSRTDHIKHMRDSVERLKIWAILLAKQADELEQTGKITTSMYYPEPEND